MVHVKVSTYRLSLESSSLNDNKQEMIRKNKMQYMNKHILKKKQPIAFIVHNLLQMRNE